MSSNRSILVGVALFFALAAARVSAQSFTVTPFAVAGGGATSTAGGSFVLAGTIGQPDAGGPMTGGSFTLIGGFWPAAAAAAPALPGDCDGDGDVDLLDFAELEACLGGTGGSTPPACDCADLNTDSAIDLRDFAEFQVQFTG